MGCIILVWKCAKASGFLQGVHESMPILAWSTRTHAWSTFLSQLREVKFEGVTFCYVVWCASSVDNDQTDVTVPHQQVSVLELCGSYPYPFFLSWHTYSFSHCTLRRTVIQQVCWICKFTGINLTTFEFNLFLFCTKVGTVIKHKTASFCRKLKLCSLHPTLKVVKVQALCESYRFDLF